MKRVLILFLTMAIILSAVGCGRNDNASVSVAEPTVSYTAEEEPASEIDDTETPSEETLIDGDSSTIDDVAGKAITESTGNAPIWATGTQVDGELFQNLNLDGVGDYDDEAYVSIYHFGDYEDKVTVISIHLGTGETVAQVLPVYGDYSLQTGKLFSNKKDAIILEVRNSTSNYGAATVFVLNVSPVGIDPIPSAGILLNTTESVMLADGEIIDTTAYPNLVTGGTKVVDIEGMPRQGVLIYSVGEEGEYQGLPRIFYWLDHGWTIIPEESSENDDNARINEGEIYAYIVGIDTDKISIVEVEMGWVPNFDPDLMGLHEGMYYDVKDALIEQFNLSTDCVIDVIPEPYDERKIVSTEEFIAYLQENWENSSHFIPYTIKIADGEISEMLEHYIP